LPSESLGDDSGHPLWATRGSENLLESSQDLIREVPRSVVCVCFYTFDFLCLEQRWAARKGRLCLMLECSSNLITRIEFAESVARNEYPKKLTFQFSLPMSDRSLDRREIVRCNFFFF
jgi:hypothetical protein